MGGAGGRVVEVTNLNDRGAGSLRAACEQTGARIIVFRVGGTIALSQPIELKEDQSKVTIAGQTAPGGGILLKNYGLKLTGTRDVAIQHLRIHPGRRTDGYGILVSGSSESRKAEGIVIDHCSIYWPDGPAVMFWGHVKDATLQWCLLDGLGSGKGLEAATDDGKGAQLRNVTVRNSAFAHCVQASPSLFADGPFHLVNNVIYDWKNFGTAIQNFGNGTRVNLIGNQYVRGPLSNRDRYAVALEAKRNPDGHVYVLDNIGPYRTDSRQPDWAIVGSGYIADRTHYWTVPAPLSLQKTTPWPDSPIPAQAFSSGKTIETVLASVGANRPERSNADSDAVTEIKRGRKSMSASRLDELPESTQASQDTDRDGMPDAWEKDEKLDPKDPSDANQPHRSGSGYSNLEEYLNPSR